MFFDVGGIIQDNMGSVFGNAPMMQLGDFQFCLNTAVYQELARSSGYRWASIERFGQQEALQYLGLGTDTVTLEGVIYPNYRGGSMQIHRLRLLAEKGLPQHLIEGGGTIFGRYIIESIEERQAEFLNQGKFQKQTFTLKLRQFDRAIGTGSLENPVVTQLNDFIKGLL